MANIFPVQCCEKPWTWQMWETNCPVKHARSTTNGPREAYPASDAGRRGTALSVEACAWPQTRDVRLHSKFQWVLLQTYWKALELHTRTYLDIYICVYIDYISPSKYIRISIERIQAVKTVLLAPPPQKQGLRQLDPCSPWSLWPEVQKSTPPHDRINCLKFFNELPQNI